MESLSSKLDSIRVKVQVPGTEISAEMRDRDRVTISFGYGVYDGLSERDLERYMTSLARLLFVAWTREYHASLSEEFRQHVLGGPENPVDREYFEARSLIVSFGQSGDGRISVGAKGMQDIRISVSDGTVRALSEREFAERTRDAVSALAKDHMAKIGELKKRFYS